MAQMGYQKSRTKLSLTLKRAPSFGFKPWKVERAARQNYRRHISLCFLNNFILIRFYSNFIPVLFWCIAF